MYMYEDRPDFGQRLAQLGAIEFWPEPLDGIGERLLKTIREEWSCPHWSADSVHALNSSGRIWCGRYD
jgi:hypothetical protein